MRILKLSLFAYDAELISKIEKNLEIYKQGCPVRYKYVGTHNTTVTGEPRVQVQP